MRVDKGEDGKGSMADGMTSGSHGLTSLAGAHGMNSESGQLRVTAGQRWARRMIRGASGAAVCGSDCCCGRCSIGTLGTFYVPHKLICSDDGPPRRVQLGSIHRRLDVLDWQKCALFAVPGEQLPVQDGAAEAGLLDKRRIGDVHVVLSTEVIYVGASPRVQPASLSTCQIVNA
jgi:hypothetical protein